MFGSVEMLLQTSMQRIPIRLLAATVLLITAGTSFGQSILSNLPPSVKWNQINTENFKVIFPEDYNGANRVANTLQHLYSPVGQSLNTNTRKISVILQNQNSISNGFVTLGPRRSEFFTMSPQTYSFLGTNDWLDLLSVHEFRHVVQFDKSRTGFTKFIYLLLGEYAQSGLAFAAVPAWFWEGDAVGIETALTNSGRGRLPNFSMAFRASFLENGPFNYHKQYLRSFRHFIPNHYVLGYHLTTHLRRERKDNVWDPIVSDAFSKPFIPFTFSNSIKKHTGNYVVKTYNAMADSLVKIWRDQIETLDLTDFERLNNRNSEVYTNFQYPQAMEDGSIIAQKSGFSDIQKFIRIGPDGSETKLFTPGFQNNPGYISIGGNQIVWTEYQYDPRWDQRSYSIVKSYNLKTGQVRKVTNKTRFSGASIAPDGTKIVVINNSTNGNIDVRVITANLGNPMKAFENPENHFYSMPRWSRDGKDVVVIKHGFQSKEIVKINFETGLEEVILPSSSENVGYPVLEDNILFFNSDISGIDNIYAQDLETGERWQITSSKFGAFNPTISPDKDFIYYNDFTVNGMDIVKIPFELENWTKISDVITSNVKYYEPLIEQEGNPDIFEFVPKKENQVTKYGKGAKMFNIHSWGPYFGTSITDIELGVSFKDVLSTNSGFVGYNFDLDETKVEDIPNGIVGKWVAEYSYQGLFPILDVQASAGKRRTSEIVNDSTNNLRTVIFDWEEKGINAGFRIPLNLTSSKYSVGLSLSEKVGYNYVSNFTNDYLGEGRLFNQQGNGDLISNNFQVSFYSLLKTSKRDINSQWGLISEIIRQGTPYGGDFAGGLTALLGRFYFPGLSRHHSLNFLTGYQHRKVTYESGEYWFPNRTPFPRGHGSTVWEDFYTIRSNYELTLWNADLAMGPILNIQRIRTELFYDYGYGERIGIDATTGQEFPITREYWSVGAELLFDFNFMRLLPLFDGGIRAVYTPENNLQFEIVIGNIGI
jgi:hypothetical protein